MTESDTGQWDVREPDAHDMDVRSFFLEISGVPTPEYQDFDTIYEVAVDGEPVGMAAVDTFSRPLLFGIGVLPDFRQEGVGSALLRRCLEDHDRLYCRVRKDNDAGMALCEAVGMEQYESMWPNELWSYEAPEEHQS